MSITLTAAQSALAEQDPWGSWRIEEDVLEQLEAQQVREAVVVYSAAGVLLFAVTPPMSRWA